MLRVPTLCLRRYASGSTGLPVYLTGIQPTGVPHLGNYFGFIKSWLQIQEKEDTAARFLFVADLHAITTFLPDSHVLRKNILEMAAGLLACGVDPKKTCLFQQSQVPEHTELAWILGALQTVAQLTRLPQFKDKSKKYKKGQIPIGLMSYPVLQGADVFLYSATHVPVGEDQGQHMNLLVDLAESFNRRYNTEAFPVPQMVRSIAPRIKSLRNPGNKMSKSDSSDFSRININDDSDTIRSKIRRALTDTNGTIEYDWTNRPAIANLVSLKSAFTGKSPEVIVAESADMDTLKFKDSLADIIDAEFKPIRQRFDELCSDEGYVWNLLRESSNEARQTAVQNLARIKILVGFDRSC